MQLSELGGAYEAELAIGQMQGLYGTTVLRTFKTKEHYYDDYDWSIVLTSLRTP